MEQVIVYQNHYPDTREIKEYMAHLGYAPVIVSKIDDLLRIPNGEIYSKVYVEIKGLSDIFLIASVQSNFSNAEIILIVEPHLHKIINILTNVSYNTIHNLIEPNKKEHKRSSK